ncbi:octopamine receptor beta-3R-like [Lytechinus variegatus]|uniref:octopamine receptor beta-3R-like n=1 Tax=Lytechinus variegatus TaxID=7654 RepID=UPI001BB1F0F7|nr:octopamine receptor beta-3R-like [Lytechinus variegatus]
MEATREESLRKVTSQRCPHEFNQTEDNGIMNLEIFQAYTIPMIPLAVFVVIGNSLVISAVYRKRALRTPTNLILTSLAVADLLTGLVACPLQSFALYKVFTPQATTSVILTLPYVVFSGIAFIHIVGVTIDRHIAITRPLRYATLVTHKRVGLGIVLTWVLCVAGFAVRTTFSVIKNISEGGSIICEADEFKTPIARIQAWSILAFISVLTPLLIVFNIRIMYIAMKKSTVIRGQRDTFEHLGQPSLRSGRLKAVKTTVIIVGAFLVSWIPVYAYFLVQLADVGGIIFRDVLAVVSLLSVVLSSAVNPCIYCYRDREFRQAFLCKRLQRSASFTMPGCRQLANLKLSVRHSPQSSGVDVDVNYNSIVLTSLDLIDNTECSKV